MTDLWFTKEQIDAEQSAGRFNSPYDEGLFRSRILQDWLVLYAERNALQADLNKVTELALSAWPETNPVYVDPVQAVRVVAEDALTIREAHPRAVKLMRKGKPFVVVAEDEPYYMHVYRTIRNFEKRAGRWTEEDEIHFREAFQRWALAVNIPFDE